MPKGGKRPNSGPRKSHPSEGTIRLEVISDRVEKTHWRKALAWAVAKEDIGNMVRILAHIGEMKRGRAYVAENPALTRKAIGDPRLGAAITAYLPEGSRLAVESGQVAGKSPANPKQIEATQEISSQSAQDSTGRAAAPRVGSGAHQVLTDASEGQPSTREVPLG
jgi:hypothetical protein